MHTTTCLSWVCYTGHTRACGEHRRTAGSTVDRIGSSPLARGTLLRAGLAGGPWRIIPARAGNTSDRSPTACVATDHPRSRGEHILFSAMKVARGGSSPLARGTQLLDPGHAFLGRIIPARAGNTRARRVSWLQVSDHPRSRGEHTSFGTESIPPCGSSPLARGTHLVQRLVEQIARIIPARAGNTDARERAADEMAGSSPLARGTRLAKLPIMLDERIIPARAGNTEIFCMEEKSMPDHPRSRGEHSASSTALGCRIGSSPLARGTPPPGQG